MLTRFRVEDKSMLPNLAPGDFVVANRLSYLFREPAVGELVVLRHPTEKTHLIKRIAAVSGGIYSVRGDNSEESEDSRHFGPVRKEAIVGRVVMSGRARRSP